MRRRFLCGALGFGGLLALVILAQLLYPAGRLLPFVRIGGDNYGGQTVRRATSKLQEKYDRAYVEFQAGGAASAISFEEIGLDVAATSTIMTASKYSLAQRFIPFSSVVHMLRRDAPVSVRIDNERVHYFAEQLEKQGMIPAVNAAVKLENDRLIMVSGKPSESFPAEATYKAILAAEVSPGIHIAPSPVVKQADISNTDAADMLANAQKIINAPLTIRVGDQETAVDKTMVASWLDFPAADGKLQLAFKTDKIEQYIQTLQEAAYKAPTATRITIVDGHETSRAVGVQGKGLDIHDAATQIETHLRSLQTDKLTLKTVALAPGTTYDRSYSATSAGLTVLLSDLAAGKDYGIAVTEVTGKGRTGGANGDKVYLAASTYKLFVAYSVFKLVDSGELHWNDSISGLTADVCLEKMIVNSDNPCATAFGEKIGWSRVQDMMRGLGLHSTSLAADGKFTTANDLALYLRKLADGSLLSGGNTDLLLGYMKRQIYRKGIPAGTGVVVADKVGFLYGYIHDAGIVYGASGPYVMVVMTNNSSWPAIATIASQVHTYITK